jgi:hypothetical protein
MSPGTLSTALVLACGAAAAQVSPQPLIGKGWGLDHVQITQPSDAEARETYATRLGFSVPPSSRSPEMGLEGTSISLPPSYLEIGLIYDRERASAYFREMTPGLARQAGMANYAAVLSRLQNKEGFIRGYFIDVAPVEDAAAFLRLVGKKVTLPPPPTYLVDGKQQPGGWQDLFIEEEPSVPAGVPGGPGIGFVEYRNNESRIATEARLRQVRERIEKNSPDDRRKPGDLHANTARKLSAVWIAVPNVEDAVRRAQSIGLAPGRERKLSALGAFGREVSCGQSQIVYWNASSDDSPLATAVRRQGPGPFGVSVGVSDLNRAHEIVEKGTGKHFQIDRSGAQPAFLVSPEDAGGIWIEFVQS